MVNIFHVDLIMNVCLLTRIHIKCVVHVTTNIEDSPSHLGRNILPGWRECIMDGRDWARSLIRFLLLIILANSVEVASIS